MVNWWYPAPVIARVNMTQGREGTTGSIKGTTSQTVYLTAMVMVIGVTGHTWVMDTVVVSLTIGGREIIKTDEVTMATLPTLGTLTGVGTGRLAMMTTGTTTAVRGTVVGTTGGGRG